MPREALRLVKDILRGQRRRSDYDELYYGMQDVEALLEDYSRVGRKRFTRVSTPTKPKRKLSAWNKFVKANSTKKEFRYRNGKLNLKKMGVAFRRKRRK